MKHCTFPMYKVVLKPQQEYQVDYVNVESFLTLKPAYDSVLQRPLTHSQ